MTALEEIKKALEGVTPVTWSYQFTEENGEVFIIANELGGLIGAALPWPTEVDEKDFRRVVAYAKYIATANPEAISELISTLESLQAKNEGLLKRAATAEKRLRGANTAFERERKLHLKNQELNRKLEARAEAAEAEVKRLREALQNVMGCYDTPLSRRRFPPDGFMTEAINTARTALASTGGEHHAE